MIHEIFHTKHSAFTAPDVHMHASLRERERGLLRERERERERGLLRERE